MPLATNVFTPGNPPNHSAELMQIALKRPDIFGAFSKGYDQAQKAALQKQAMALAEQKLAQQRLQYNEALQKANTAALLYPGDVRLQMALQAQKMNALNNPSQYPSSTSAVTPVNTRRDPTGAPLPVPQGSSGVISSGVDPKLADPGAGFGGFFSPGDFAPTTVNPGGNTGITIPTPAPAITDIADFNNSYAGDPGLESPYLAGDFLS